MHKIQSPINETNIYRSCGYRLNRERSPCNNIKNHCPTELKDEKKTLRSDLVTGHEESDNIIIQQTNHMGQQDCSINVMCEDTDVFILLCHFCNSEEWNAKVFMNGFTKDSSTTISINEAVTKHKSIVPSILDGRALKGCDSFPKLHAIGKAKAINSLKSVSLSVFGNPESSEAEYMDDAKRFITRCYGADSKNSSENSK